MISSQFHENIRYVEGVLTVDSLGRGRLRGGSADGESSSSSEDGKVLRRSILLFYLSAQCQMVRYELPS